jgi:hypothetical protein
MNRNRQMTHIGISSNLYPLEAGDIAKLPDYTQKDIDLSAFSDDIVILIEKNKPDSLLKGREYVENIPEREHVNVRVAFVPSVPKWFIFPNFTHPLRKRFIFDGSNTYHISVYDLRALDVERTKRDKSNAYKLRQYKFDDKECIEKYEALTKSIKTNGYDDTRPMNVMVCRKGGFVDSMKQGHHRMGICIENNIKRVAIQFSAAGYMPRSISRLFKNWKGKSIKTR